MSDEKIAATKGEVQRLMDAGFIREVQYPTWPARHNLAVVDYKALTGLSLLQVPHFHARRVALLKVIHPDTMSTSITKCFLVSR
jgi:hypothetical protein